MGQTKELTVGHLKELLQGYPDEMPVMVKYLRWGSDIEEPLEAERLVTMIWEERSGWRETRFKCVTSQGEETEVLEITNAWGRVIERKPWTDGMSCTIRYTDGSVSEIGPMFKVLCIDPYV